MRRHRGYQSLEQSIGPAVMSALPRQLVVPPITVDPESKPIRDHVLQNHERSLGYKRAPELCLAAFDELVALGLDAFTKQHDPYWDIPLVTTLPKPVIDLGLAAPAAPVAADAPYKLTPPEPKAKSKRGKR